MLPESLFNSSQAEPVAETKQTQKVSFPAADSALSRSNQEFKNALSTTMGAGNKSINKQIDKAHNKSELLTNNNSKNEQDHEPNLQYNIQLASQTNNDKNINRIKHQNISIEQGKHFNRNLSQHHIQRATENTSAEKVATDGKVLPEQLLNKSVKDNAAGVEQSVKPGNAHQQKINNTVNNSGQSNNSQTNATTRNALLINPDNKITNPIDGKQSVGNQTNPGTAELQTNLNAKDPEMKRDIAGLSKNELQQKLASIAIPAKENTSNVIKESGNSASSADLKGKVELNPTKSENSAAKQQTINLSLEAKSLDTKALLSAYSAKSLNLESIKAKLTDAPASSQKTAPISAELLLQQSIQKQTDLSSEKGKVLIANKLGESASIPESGKFDLLQRAAEKLSPETSRLDRITEQLFQQSSREDTVSKVLTANNTSSQSAAKPVSTMINDTAIVQTNQLNSTQVVSKPAELSLPVSLPTQQWNHKFAEQVSMMILRGNTQANIRLDPPELGPMAIRVNHTGTETQIQFQVNNPIARDLIDSGMNRLREMLEQHGFENVDVDVSEQGERAHDSSTSLADNDDLENETEVIDTELLPENKTFSSKSLVDIFA